MTSLCEHYAALLESQGATKEETPRVPPIQVVGQESGDVPLRTLRSTAGEAGGDEGGDSPRVPPVQVVGQESGDVPLRTLRGTAGEARGDEGGHSTSTACTSRGPRRPR